MVCHAFDEKRKVSFGKSIPDGAPFFQEILSQCSYPVSLCGMSEKPRCGVEPYNLLKKTCIELVCCRKGIPFQGSRERLRSPGLTAYRRGLGNVSRGQRARLLRWGRCCRATLKRIVQSSAPSRPARASQRNGPRRDQSIAFGSCVRPACCFPTEIGHRVSADVSRTGSPDTDTPVVPEHSEWQAVLCRSAGMRRPAGMGPVQRRYCGALQKKTLPSTPLDQEPAALCIAWPLRPGRAPRGSSEPEQRTCPSPASRTHPHNRSLNATKCPHLSRNPCALKNA
jgi:hypothetical protein